MTENRSEELRIALELCLVVQDEESADGYGDNYIRRMSGPILLAGGGLETVVKSVRCCSSTSTVHARSIMDLIPWMWLTWSARRSTAKRRRSTLAGCWTGTSTPSPLEIHL